MVRMNFIFSFISSSNLNLLPKKLVKRNIKKRWPYYFASAAVERVKLVALKIVFASTNDIPHYHVGRPLEGSLKGSSVFKSP